MTGTAESQPISSDDLWQWRQQAQRAAEAAGIPAAEIDWLLQEVAGLDRLTLRLGLRQDSVPLTCSLAHLDALWQRRLQQQVPVQYLAGSAPWRQFRLTVTPAVLIPRPETELLIDLAVAAVRQTNLGLAHGHWADLGTGSGAIAIGLADVFPNATIHAIDASEAALAVAQQNAQQVGFEQRIRFYHGSWFEPLPPDLQGQLSGMVSNPPYIPSALIADLQPEVAQHEPHVALDGGDTGLDCIRHLVTTAPAWLRSGGLWLIELMAGQADAVAELLDAEGCYHSIQIHADLAGIQRFALAYRK
ncbi:MAG: peptide chain release factor N(5)-glutamine methyltransferase [Synechococcales cyanobacterium C42_A2020_086]|jgi:release factor glutamine methyltransferase|nr:peptide chain release factor N(5)-glutamine methyltransferase [Synechococcales cyanobacterium C42_A2020_086]